MNTAQSQTGFFDNVSVYFDQAGSFTQHPKGLLDQIQTREIWNSDPRILSLRTAAFIGAINKTATCCAELGIFP